MRSVAMVAGGVVALSGAAAASGEAHVVIPFDLEAGEVAEGVAVDLEGNVFTGISGQGRFLKLMKGSDEAEPFFELAGLQEGDFGLTGMALNGDRDQYMHGLYAAAVSSNPALNGVHMLDPYGRSDPGNEWWHIEGTERMAMANAIAFDESADHMYVSDSATGQIWRLKLHGFVGYAEPEVWIDDPLLEGTGALPFPFPVGANGVAVRDGTVFVAVTEQGTVVGVPILEDGAAGESFVYAELPGTSPDGIAFDEAGNLYVADPAAHTLWKYEPDGTITAVADVDDGLSGPSSVALWEDEDGLVAYVSNQAIGPEGTVKHGPSIIAVSVD
ncbi:MAG: hypothetical protein AB1Z67_08675 [Candidatus Limnocylindrales bacterium]